MRPTATQVNCEDVDRSERRSRGRSATSAAFETNFNPSSVPSLFNPVQSVRQLDIRTPRIPDERDRDIEGRDFGVRAFELDAVRFELLGERLEIVHFEPDVIDRP